MDSFRNTRTTCQNIKNTRTNNSNTSLVKIILMFNRFDSAMKTTTTTTKKTEDRPAAASRTPKQQEFHFRNKTKKNEEIKRSGELPSSEQRLGRERAGSDDFTGTLLFKSDRRGNSSQGTRLYHFFLFSTSLPTLSIFF